MDIIFSCFISCISDGNTLSKTVECFNTIWSIVRHSAHNFVLNFKLLLHICQRFCQKNICVCSSDTAACKDCWPSLWYIIFVQPMNGNAQNSFVDSWPTSAVVQIWSISASSALRLLITSLKSLFNSPWTFLKAHVCLAANHSLVWWMRAFPLYSEAVNLQQCLPVAGKSNPWRLQTMWFGSFGAVGRGSWSFFDFQLLGDNFLG